MMMMMILCFFLQYGCPLHIAYPLVSIVLLLLRHTGLALISVSVVLSQQ